MWSGIIWTLFCCWFRKRVLSLISDIVHHSSSISHRSDKQPAAANEHDDLSAMQQTGDVQQNNLGRVTWGEDGHSWGRGHPWRRHYSPWLCVCMCAQLGGRQTKRKKKPWIQQGFHVATGHGKNGKEGGMWEGFSFCMPDFEPEDLSLWSPVTEECLKWPEWSQASGGALSPTSRTDRRDVLLSCCLPPSEEGSQSILSTVLHPRQFALRGQLHLSFRGTDTPATGTSNLSPKLSSSGREQDRNAEWRLRTPEHMVCVLERPCSESLMGPMRWFTTAFRDDPGCGVKESFSRRFQPKPLTVETIVWWWMLRYTGKNEDNWNSWRCFSSHKKGLFVRPKTAKSLPKKRSPNVLQVFLQDHTDSIWSWRHTICVSFQNKNNISKN